jgi:iron complex outermembrane recepter protein
MTSEKRPLLAAGVAIIVAAAMMPALPVSVASAQDAEPALELEEVLVSARKREENLMQVPVAVSVMTSEAIEETGVSSLSDLSAFTPGLNLKSQGAGSIADRSLSRLVFRGLASSEGTMFIDGAPYAGSGAPECRTAANDELQSRRYGRRLLVR